MAREQGGGKVTAGKAKDERRQARVRQAGSDSAPADPQTEAARQPRAVRTSAQRGRPESGKGRDARALREAHGANARRGNQAEAEADEEEDEREEEEEEKEEGFWKDLVAEAYRSRKRRGEWDGSEGPG